jgi:hypothetical protein
MVLPARVVEAIRGIGTGGVGMNLLNVLNGDRPRRSLCKDGPRPCPWTECRHRMEPRREADWAIPAPTCALDVADLVEQGEEPPTLEDIGAWYGVTRERIRQIARQARRSFIEKARERGLPWRMAVTETTSVIENEILALMPECGITLPDIVAKSGHSRTVIRYHLGQMARCGLVTRRPIKGAKQQRWLWFVRTP